VFRERIRQILECDLMWLDKKNKTKQNHIKIFKINDNYSNYKFIKNSQFIPNESK